MGIGAGGTTDRTAPPRPGGTRCDRRDPVARTTATAHESGPSGSSTTGSSQSARRSPWPASQDARPATPGSAARPRPPATTRSPLPRRQSDSPQRRPHGVAGHDARAPAHLDRDDGERDRDAQAAAQHVRDQRVARIGVVAGVAGQADVDEQAPAQRVRRVDAVGEPVERPQPAVDVGIGFDGGGQEQGAAVERRRVACTNSANSATASITP